MHPSPLVKLPNYFLKDYNPLVFLQSFVFLIPDVRLK